MPDKFKFKLLLLVLFVSSCTFGEGPELIEPDSEQTTELNEIVNDGALVTSASSQPATVNGTSAQTQITNDQLNPSSVGEQAGSTNSSSDGIGSVVAGGSDISGASDAAATDNAQSTNSQDGTSDRIVRIPRTDTANAPIIDGSAIDYIPGTKLLGGEWRFAAQFNGAGEPLGITHFMFGDADQALTESYHHWAAMHDGEYLYLVVIVDDDGQHFQDTNEERKLWKDDSVELFIDGNHSQLPEYDGVDDFHMTVNLLASEGVSNASYNANPNFGQSLNSASLPSDLIFKTGLRQGPLPLGADRVRKDIYEFRIKLSELNIELEAPFGMELQVNDDDDGGTRDAKWAWHHPQGDDSSNDLTWQNPSLMGTAILKR